MLASPVGTDTHTEWRLPDTENLASCIKLPDDLQKGVLLATKCNFTTDPGLPSQAHVESLLFPYTQFIDDVTTCSVNP